MWTVLLVEDEPQAREYVRAVFQKVTADFRVVGEANHGEEAIAFIREHEPDLVISDIVMPVMDGVELLQTAREEGFDCRFVMLTCMSDFEYARQAVEYGASGYLLKLSMDAVSLERTLSKVGQELRQRGKLRKIERYLSDVTEPSLQPTDHPTVNQVIALIQNHYRDNLSLSSLAEQVNIDSSYLSDLFRKKTGDTVTHYMQKVRVEAAKLLLLETDRTVSEIGEQVGFVNDNYFIKIFKKWTGATPSDFRRKEK
ncbi:response regulator [Paenibacillus chartarius]|uniref:Response regulator n=1 Tax=Paenibacillus chartarius TaxID=747481 RepID=A0ABV6DN79_9BACL